MDFPFSEISFTSSGTFCHQSSRWQIELGKFSIPIPMEISIELNDGMFFHTSVCWHLSRNDQKQNSPSFKKLYRLQKDKLFGHREYHSYQGQVQINKSNAIATSIDRFSYHLIAIQSQQAKNI